MSLTVRTSDDLEELVSEKKSCEINVSEGFEFLETKRGVVNDFGSFGIGD